MRIPPCGMPGHCPTASVPVRVIWQLERDTSHIPAVLEYPRVSPLGIDQGIWIASQECSHDWFAKSSLPYCRYGVGHCLAGR